MKRLAPFQHQNFRRFFFVQTISLTGTWAADLARSWLILSVMHSATALGGLLMATAIPGLFLILHGGVLVDRVDVRRLMIVTKLCLALIALVLALLVQFSQVDYWVLLIFALLEGIVTAFDSPAYQALTVRLVPRHDFQQALALNSTNFHAARMMGPLVAGLLMTWTGPSTVFLVDGLTYLGLVLLLRTIDLRQARIKVLDQTKSQWRSLWEGIAYIFKTPTLRYRVIQLLLTISLVHPLLSVVFRTYLKAKFNLDAESFGMVFTIPALGSMCGALGFAVVQPKVPIRALFFGIPAATVTMYLVMLMPTPMTSALMMGLSGFSMYLTFAALTVSMQLEVEERFRGRMSSVVGLCFVSIGPLMGFPIGTMADLVGFEFAITVLTGAFFVASGVLALLHRQTRKRLGVPAQSTL